MSPTLRILVALGAGLACGIAIGQVDGAAAGRIADAAEPIGKAWLALLQMPLVPLIFGLLVTGIASAAATVSASRIAGRAIILFTVLLFAAASIATAFVLPVLAASPPPAGLLATLGGSHAPPGETASGADWLLSFIPANPLAAAAEGRMAAVLVFALLFGFAATRIADAPRARLLGPIEAMVDVLLVMIGWVLWLAPLGVFALAFVAGSRAGLSAAGALIHYVTIVSAACIVVTLLVYPLAVAAGRIGLGRFARAIAPVQAIAFSTQSSIASLPAMLKAADEELEVRRETRALVLPMAVSLFRLTSPVANLAVVYYIAAVHGIALTPWAVAIGILVAFPVSVATVGLPSQLSFFTSISPICLAMGVPLDLLALLIAVEIVPDIFRTIGNVTADLAATRIVDRWGSDAR